MGEDKYTKRDKCSFTRTRGSYRVEGTENLDCGQAGSLKVEI